MEMLHNILKNFLYYNPLQETPVSQIPTAFCVPTQYTLYVENPECAFCVAVNTTICAGYCMTRDVNVRGLLPRMALSQTVCTYQDLAYRTIRLPGCAPQVNPFYTYPVALTCKCGKCNTDFSDCRGGSSLSRDAQTSLSPATSSSSSGRIPRRSQASGET
uniref:Thyrotropin subunit beta n=1 Tax=Erpetoichthys calabaricus TaxID=27687 RepID=A0A8C4S290_ERPCA